MRICLVLEGSYPYVHGGVSTWMHAYIQAMPQQEFSLWVIGAKAQDRGKFVYELPPNVKEVEEVFLDDALRLHGERQPVLFTADERTALRELVRLGSPDWDVLYRLFQEKGVHPLSFLQSRDFMELFKDICLQEYPYVAYADAFHTMRSMLLPVLYLLTGRVPKADVYHAISTGYGGPPYGTRYLHPRTGGGDHPRRVGGALVQEPMDPILLYAFRGDLPAGVPGQQSVL